jgi:hypothetical protein
MVSNSVEQYGRRSIMRVFQQPFDLLGTTPLVQHAAVRAGARVLSDVRDGALKAVAVIAAVWEPVGRRLKAPLIPPQQFGSVREYRMWKASRATRPQSAGPLQWPLGVWLLIGLVLTAWIGAKLS